MVFNPCTKHGLQAIWAGANTGIDWVVASRGCGTDPELPRAACIRRRECSPSVPAAKGDPNVERRGSGCATASPLHSQQSPS